MKKKSSVFATLREIKICEIREIREKKKAPQAQINLRDLLSSRW